MLIVAAPVKREVARAGMLKKFPDPDPSRDIRELWAVSVFLGGLVPVEGLSLVGAGSAASPASVASLAVAFSAYKRQGKKIKDDR